MIQNPTEQDIFDLEYNKRIIIEIGSTDSGIKFDGKKETEQIPERLTGKKFSVKRTGSHTVQPCKPFDHNLFTGIYYNIYAKQISVMYFEETDPEEFI